MSATSTFVSPLGVCVLPARPRNAARTVSYGQYIHEILAHAGLCYQNLAAEEIEKSLPNLSVLVTVGDNSLPDATRDALARWVEEGGMWLMVGGTAGLSALLGVREEPATYSGWGANIGTLGEGYLQVTTPDHPVLAHVPLPLHFFNGVTVHASTGIVHASVLDAHGRETPRAAVVERRVGSGRCLLIAPDVTGTVVRIQQGIAVTRDGVSAPDGTAPICDDMLKSSDGGVLDWWFDRQPVEGVPGFSAFLHPVADIWREMVIRAILYLAQVRKVVLPMLWLYPRNLPALAHLSHDTDGNEPHLAERMLEVLAEAGIRSTWCVIPPGYPQSLIKRIGAEGHELAMHFDAVEEDTVWDEGAFHEQWRVLKRLFGGDPPRTNKNHYLRWEGDTEFFEWCQRRGIQLDQSKGPSKTGEAGFNFGTCHPYFPIDPKGRPIDVLELPTLSQDLNVFAPDALLEPLLNAVARHHGVLHLLFHPAHVEKPGIAETILRSIRRAQERGMEWWTARRINEWERARRGMRWLQYQQQDGVITIRLQSDQPLQEATLLLTAEHGEISADIEAFRAERTERWGFPMTAVTLNLHGEVTLRLRVS
ncbi:MAG: hypothetical protein KatS3mg023_3490 [Armatimonadota bacterium]|nr:MAG: hypothetical protein KatS3mg023_3490 [Armatimonadota bacterium]